MLMRYGLAPAVFIGYERIAYFGIEDPSLRITFDMNLRYRLTDLTPGAGSAGEPFAKEDLVIMEIKFPSSAPLWLAQLLSEMNIYPGSFSKVGTCLKEKIVKGA